jgi:hypothetical protein
MGKYVLVEHESPSDVLRDTQAAAVTAAVTAAAAANVAS